MAKVILLFVVFFLGAVLSEMLRYDGQQVIKVHIQSEDEMKSLQEILPVDVDIWSHDSNLIVGENHIRVAPALYKNITRSGFKVEPMITDLQAHIELNSPPRNLSDPTWYNNYHTYTEIVQRLQYIVSLYPTRATFVSSIGTSIQGRSIPAILLGSTAPQSKKIVWTGGQHAREWIGPATVLYQIEQVLAEDAAGDAVSKSLLNNLQFVVVPIVNPDGYNHAWTGDRMWRKNRRANAGGTYGVDLNRNWDSEWGGGGSSGTPSSDTYRGTAVFSEPESKATADYIRSFTVNRIIAAIDFHSYSQLILRPWGYTKTNCPDETALRNYGANMAAAIKAKYGLTYTNQKSIDLYVTTGTASDWYYKIGIVGAYTIELRDLNTFVLPPNQIIPTGIEVWAAVKDFTKAIAGL